MDQLREMAEQAREMARDQAEQARDQAREQSEQAREMVREQAELAREQARAALDMARPLNDQIRDGIRGGILGGINDGIRGGIGLGIGGGIGNVLRDTISSAPLLAQGRINIGRGPRGEENLYDAGHRALDNYKYDEALADFNQVSAIAGAHADAALYWKAYALLKLGRRDEALAAIADLRKAHPNSRWLDDAKALELEVKQASGPVSPENESDVELKLMAINSIMQSDPEKAIPLLETMLKGSQPPKVKDRALFVLAQSSAPRAQQVIEQIARGGGNPDLQLKAINYLTQRRRQGSGNPNLLPEIYGSTTDVSIKRAIIRAWDQSRDKDHLAQAAKNEKAPELRTAAFRALANNNPGQPELWPIFQAETSPEVRQEILQCMYQDGNADKLAEVVRTEKDPKTRKTAIDVLASQRAADTGSLLVSVYNAEQDPQNKQAIIDRFSNERNAKYLVDLARNEKDSKLKLRIVDRLSRMKSKEASDYLMELLSK